MIEVEPAALQSDAPLGLAGALLAAAGEVNATGSQLPDIFSPCRPRPVRPAADRAGTLGLCKILLGKKSLWVILAYGSAEL